MIASHHGRYEWQSPELPKTIEAVLLHQLDMLEVGHGQILSTDGYIRRAQKPWMRAAMQIWTDYGMGESANLE